MGGLLHQSCINRNEIPGTRFQPCCATAGQVYYNPYVYNHVVGLKSAPCVNAANVPVPCAGYYGKRDAEADPAYVYAAAAVPFGSSTGLDPITQGLDAVTQG